MSNTPTSSVINSDSQMGAAKGSKKLQSISNEDGITSSDLPAPINSKISINSPEDTRKVFDSLSAQVKDKLKVSEDEAIKFVFSQPAGVYRNSCLGVLGANLSRYPNDKIIPVLEKIKDKNEYSSLILGLFRQINESYDLAFDKKIETVNYYIENIVDDGHLSRIYASAARIMFANEYQEGKKWLLSLEDSVAHEADGAMVRRFAVTDPKLGIDLLQNFINLEKFDRFDAVSVEFVESYRYKDSLASTQWVLQLPDDIPSKESMLITTFAQLYHDNPIKAEELMKAISNDAFKQTILKKFDYLRKELGLK